MMQRFIFLLIIGFISQTIYSLDRDIKYYSPNEIIDYDTVRYMVLDSSFENSFKEMEGMFNGTIPYSLKWNKIFRRKLCWTSESIQSIVRGKR